MKALGKWKSTKVSKNLLYNKDSSFILQSSNVKYNKPFKLYIHICICIYIYIYIYIYIQSWKQCAPLVIPKIALWQVMHLGTWCASCTTCVQGMTCHKAIAVITGRAHCFHDCIWILRPSCFCEIWVLCVSWITFDPLYKYIH